MTKTAFITGIGGQDGAYLARFLLDKNYSVHGLIRPDAHDQTAYIQDIQNDIIIHHGDLLDSGNLAHLIQNISPDEIYNLAALTHVQDSFAMPDYTAQCNGLGVTRLLEAIRLSPHKDKIKFYQASTSEIFGNHDAGALLNENAPFHPCSPYAAAKLYAHWMVVTYRQAYNIHASNGILFNHESPLRGDQFVTRKITKAVANIANGQDYILYLGNLDALRDWGHAADYVRGMWLMMQHDQPDDYVLATGESHSVRECVETAFSCANIPITWTGEGIDEIGIHAQTHDILVKVDPALFRPVDVHALCGDASKAHNVLGWQPSYHFKDLIADMVLADMGDDYITPRVINS